MALLGAYSWLCAQESGLAELTIYDAELAVCKASTLVTLLLLWPLISDVHLVPVN